MPENPYHELSLEQSLSLKDALDNRYWDAVDYLGAIVADRGYLYAHLRELPEPNHE